MATTVAAPRASIAPAVAAPKTSIAPVAGPTTSILTNLWFELFYRFQSSKILNFYFEILL